jgi:bifunctional non-homologous end joining protein LigD
MKPQHPTGSTPEPAAVAKTRRPAPGAASLPDLRPYGRLAEYNRKRHFGVTPEPAGKAVTRKPGRPLQFVVQKHRAGHLHYDFRLEHRGVMLSWAIPKGPSLDPAVKRLAMETEPHPMEYNQFEGVIPEGEYGGGTVMIWDKGVWAPAAGDRLGDEADIDRQLANGDLKFVLLGEKLAGSWVLVRTRTRQWLLMKHRDEYVREEDLTIAKPLSVVSGRTLAEIAAAAEASPRQRAQAAGADPAPGDQTAETGGGRQVSRGRPARMTTARKKKPQAERPAVPTQFRKTRARVASLSDSPAATHDAHGVTGGGPPRRRVAPGTPQRPAHLRLERMDGRMTADCER